MAEEHLAHILNDIEKEVTRFKPGVMYKSAKEFKEAEGVQQNILYIKQAKQLDNYIEATQMLTQELRKALYIIYKEKLLDN